MARPSLDLTLEISNLDGSACETFPASRENVEGAACLGTMTSKWATGFEHLGGTELFRDPHKRYNSPRLLQSARVVGLGETVWEGEISSVPQSRADSLEADGYYVGLKDAGNVAEVYRDVSMERWGGIPLNRQAAILAAGYNPADANIGGGAIVTSLAQPTWNAGHLPDTEAWYTAPAGAYIGALSVDWARGGNVLAGPDPYVWALWLAADDAGASGDGGTDLQAAGPASVTLATTAAVRRFAFMQFYYSSAYGTNDSLDRSITWSNIVVTGYGVPATITMSEVIKHAVGKYAPHITADDQTIAATTYAIGHLVADNISLVELIERCNAYHLYEIGVWEDRKLWVQPSRERTDYDYLLSTYQGDELQRAPIAVDDDEPCNGVWVYYTDAQTGRAERVGPYGTTALHDANGDALLLSTNANNPCVREGRDRFPSITIGPPCIRADAVLLGSLWLAEKQVRTYAGTGVAGPYVRNRGGQRVPSWKIRAGDRVKYAGEDIIRRVHGTSYDYRTAHNSLTFEKPASTVAGLNERINTALIAAGIAA